jgi:hypothetical protein
MHATWPDSETAIACEVQCKSEAEGNTVGIVSSLQFTVTVCLVDRLGLGSVLYTVGVGQGCVVYYKFQVCSDRRPGRPLGGGSSGHPLINVYDSGPSDWPSNSSTTL